MFDKIKFWYNDNYLQITWFIIGFLSLDAIQSLGQGDWIGLVIDIVLIGLNYSFVKRQ